MPRESKIPLPTLERLATYLRYLNDLATSEVETISSAGIGEATGINAAQFRKDLSYFGEFGQPGVGYDVQDLRRRIAHILKVDQEQSVLLVGAGNLGSALLGYTDLVKNNFKIIAVFDRSPRKIGLKLWDREILDIGNIRKANESLDAKIAIISVPSLAAQGVADQLVEAGVKVILNFAPTIVKCPEGVVIRNVCFIQELTVLSFFLTSGAD